MSLDSALSGDPVHQPKRRDVFQFDNEVASIFDNMAPRSIPMYNEVHRMHVSMLKHKLVADAVVVDVGSSTGHLFRNIERQGIRIRGLKAIAVDSSQPMMDRLLREFPTVGAIVADVSKLSDEMPHLPNKADLMFCLYTLQFIPPGQKSEVLDWLVQNTKVGGYLILGQKERTKSPELAALFSEEYYQFRRDNGYSQAEIDAKTAALKGSMFTDTHDMLLKDLDTRGVESIETSRWLEFSTVLGIRRL